MAQSVTDLLRVPPGGLDLDTLDARATPGFAGKKADAAAAQAELAGQLATLQEQLYAEARKGGARSVLLVLQGMDTSGKGGTVDHVLGQMDPAGVHIASFGKPTQEELEHDFLWRIRREPPARRQGRRVRPLPLRGRRGGAGARARRPPDGRPPLRDDQPLRGQARRGGDPAWSSASSTSPRRSSASACWRGSTTRPSTGSTTPETSTRGRAGTTTWPPTRTRSRAAARRRPGTWSRPIASGTATGPSPSCCSRRWARLDLRWPPADFDVAVERRRVEQAA